jgi:hypothetical protein
LKRHEDFNRITKTFKILQGPFRHGPNKIARAFEAVSIICQYKIKRDEPLFDILIDDVLNGNDEDLDSDMEDMDDEDEEESDDKD